MTAEKTKLSEDDYIPASIRIPNLDFDSGLEHVDLIEREDRLKNLVESIKSLIHDVEMSVRKKEGKPPNVDTFTIHFVPE